MNKMAIVSGYNLVAASEVKHCRIILYLRRACYSLIVFAISIVVFLQALEPAQYLSLSSNRTLLTLPTSKIQSHWQREPAEVVESAPIHEMRIEDVVSFDSGDVLVLVRVPRSSEFPAKERIECRFGDVGQFTYTKPLALHLAKYNRARILCGAPPADLIWNLTSILIEVDQQHGICAGTVAPDDERPVEWSGKTLVVYESFATDHDLVVFLHGANSSRGKSLSAAEERERLQKFQCVFDGRYETRVTSQTQEVLRCAHPEEAFIPAVAGKKITLKFEGRLLPSLAFYNPASTTSKPRIFKPIHNICACTMLYNGAKFLKEWTHYHAHLGVEKFFIYDNNSEDNLDEVIATLNPSFNVTKQSWPWVKTQEASFSHCALAAQRDCKWMLYIDVDEYFFPHTRFLTSAASSSRLASFVKGVGGRNLASTGQIMTFCHNYGPSGLTTSPAQGVTQGYTCRMKLLNRHKSIVRLDAVAHSLANVIHHFNLRKGYKTKKIPPATAVINHYKFQAWEEFRVKFKRRAATYVADWTQNRSRSSKDRVSDLGTRAVKPADWETRFCEIQDYSLLNYTRAVFGSYDEESILHLAWE